MRETREPRSAWKLKPREAADQQRNHCEQRKCREHAHNQRKEHDYRNSSCPILGRHSPTTASLSPDSFERRQQSSSIGVSSHESCGEWSRLRPEGFEHDVNSRRERFAGHGTALDFCRGRVVGLGQPGSGGGQCQPRSEPGPNGHRQEIDHVGQPTSNSGLGRGPM